MISYGTTETCIIYLHKFKPIVRNTKHQDQGNTSLNMLAHARVKIADWGGVGEPLWVIYECSASPSLLVCVFQRTVYIVRYGGTLGMSRQEIQFTNC